MIVPPRLRRMLVVIAKISLAAAILGFLLVQVQRQAGFSRLVTEPKIWPLLAVGLLCTAAAITLTFVRWHVLLTAAWTRFSAARLDATRSVGLRAELCIAWQHRRRSVQGHLRGQGLARSTNRGSGHRRRRSVGRRCDDADAGDASRRSSSIGRRRRPRSECWCRRSDWRPWACLVGVSLILAVPALSGDRIRGWIGAIPLVGPTAARLIGTVSVYRDEKSRVAKACAISLCVERAVHSFVLFRRARAAGPVALARATFRDRPESPIWRGRSRPRPAG